MATADKQILIARAGRTLDVDPLVAVLRNEGFDVDVTQGNPVSVATSDTASLDRLLRAVDLVVLIVSREDENYNGGPVAPYQGVLHDAGLIKGRLGMDRVVFLVEENVTGLATNGASEVRFTEDAPEKAAPKLLSALRAVFPTEERDLHAARSVSEQFRTDDLWAPKILVGVVLAVMFLFIALALNSLRGSETTEVAVDYRRGMSGLVNTIEDHHGAALTPASPSTAERTLEAGNERLPTVCEIDTHKDLLLGDSITCDGIGVVRVEGYGGPWHNEIEQVALSLGTAGSLAFELRDDGTTVGPSTIDLSSGTIVLNPQDSAYGVHVLTVQFSAHAQHIHLYQSQDRGGNAATLIFELE